MNKSLVVDCKCGNSFHCDEKELRAHLAYIYVCGNKFVKDGRKTKCTERYTYLRLLKIMQITRYWNAKDEDTSARAENVQV